MNTLRDLLLNSISTYAELEVINLLGKYKLTYKEFGDRINQVSNYLIEKGIKKGDKAAILAENNPDWGVSYLAITTIGATAVPVLPEFQQNEISNILDHSESKIIFLTKKHLAKIKPTEKLEEIILLDEESTKIDLPENLRLNSIKELYNTQNNLAAKFSWEVNENDIASIIYTSGTTGSSKGVMLTHKNLVSNVISSRKIQPIDEKDRFLSLLPLSHTFENTLGFLYPIMNGSCIYYLGQAPTATILLKALKKVKPTIILAVPLIIEKIYKARIKKKFTSNKFIYTLYQVSFIKKLLHKIAGKKLYETFGGELRFFGVGGAPLSPEVESFLKDANFPYAIGYGLTETSPLLAGAVPGKTRLGSTGPAVDLVQIKIDQPDEKGEGEILAKGPNIMLGYYKDEEKTKEVFTDDGWFKTGDLGYIDTDDYLYIKGRLKNMILGPNGENIYPEEIEATLNKYQFVAESLVFENQGKLVAKVHLNFEELEAHFQHLKESALALEEKANEIINEIHAKVNQELNKFSRLNLIMVQAEPFEKTPTKKIKRYLYT